LDLAGVGAVAAGTAVVFTVAAGIIKIIILPAPFHISLVFASVWRKIKS
jgi:hypothetical protein